MEVLATSLFFAFVCSKVTGVPSLFLNLPVNSCDAAYSCADCHTTKLCRPTSSGNFTKIETIRCSTERPYCQPKSGSCFAERPQHCSDEPTNAKQLSISTHVCTGLYSCNGCHSTAVCRPTVGGTLVFVKSLPCTEDRPYCDPRSGTCVAEEPMSCGTNGNFICIHDGKYPDVDCRTYHVCQHWKSTTLKCTGPKAHYNPKVKACDEETQCTSFSCAGNNGRKVPHPLDPHYFAFCGPNGALVVDSCPGSYELNVTSQLCEATCHYNGLIEDVSDCHYYYRCTEQIITSTLKYFQKLRLKCPTGQSYDPSQYLCVSDVSNIKGCKN